MLILARKTDESIMIGDQIEISIVDIKGDQVKLGISAPKNVKIYRKEVYLAIQEENIQAVKSNPNLISELGDILKDTTTVKKKIVKVMGTGQLKRNNKRSFKNLLKRNLFLLRMWRDAGRFSH